MTTTNTVKKTQTPHILIFPFPSSGHIIPILDLAAHFLRRNLTVTVLVTTAKNQSLLSPLLSAYPHSLHSLLLSPPDQSPFEPSTAKRLIAIMRRLSELRTPILNWFKSHPSPPIAIVSDFFLGWTYDLAVEIGIPRLNFSPSGAFATALSDYLWRNFPQRGNSNGGSDDVLITFNGVPTTPVFPWWHLSHVFRNYQKGDSDWEFFRNGMLNNLKSWGIVFNSFTELERVYIDHIKTEKGDDRVWAVGPLLPTIDTDSKIDAEKRGGSSSVSTDVVLQWLDQRPERSVVYVCFGSRTVLNRNQLEALTEGLATSGVHFVLCVRDTEADGVVMEENEGLIPSGYEDRVADRGFVIKGWAPQVAILNHKAVGAFLTHCGWNSVLEGLSAGVVMLTWPNGADQFANAMMLVDQLGVGIRVGEETRNVPDPEKLAQVLIDSLYETRPERARALELKEATRSAVKGGSSEMALNDLVKRLADLQNSEKNISVVMKMNGGNNFSHAALEKLAGNNYNYWKLCMEAYLQGQDLWELISGGETVIPEDTPLNVELRRKWKIKSEKALFALRTSISKEFIEHVRDVTSPKEVWETLERLFSQKNTMRLQFLENELAGVLQCTLSISDYFLKVKILCNEITELDVEEPISEARLRRYLIRGLRKEFMSFISSVQGWTTQPSIIELENLLSNQEALVKQMLNHSVTQVDDALIP